MPAKRPAYRADRPHESFVRGLMAAGVPDSSTLVEAIVAAVSERFDLHEVGAAEVQSAVDTPHRKVTRVLPSSELSE